MDDFLIYALLAGLGVALMAGPLGVFVVWRRMAYFGDTMAHSALLGVGLGLLLEIDLNFSVVLVALLVAFLLLILQRQKYLATDTLLGILAHGALSLGLVAVALMDNVRIDLMAYLFGDVLAVSVEDLIWIWGGAAIVLLVISRIWSDLLAMTIHEDLARVEGVAVERVRMIFMGMIALVIAVAMKIVGVLLITALLIIPAAAARRISRTPEQMAWMAAGVGAVSVGLGLALSWYADTPAGPSIVVAAVALFTFSQIGKRSS